MKKRFIAAIVIGTLIIGMLSGCGNSSQENAETIIKSEETTDKETEEASGTAEEAAAKAAEEEADTYYEEGRACLYGLDGHKIDLEAAGDDPYAWLSLGFLYLNGQGVKEDTAKAQELFEAVIAEDCVEGYLGRGEIAMADEDYDTALECYSKVLEGEEQIYIAAAMYQIACNYYSGEGVEQDYTKAIEWYEKSADLDNTNAMNSLGTYYLVAQEYAKALR